MARRSKSRELSVWINGRHAADWRVPARGEVELQYQASWISAAEGRPLSLSLPFTLDNAPLKGRSVQFYFENLLPESEVIRQRIQARYRTASRDPFDLLDAIGRDCVGAIQLLPAGEQPKHFDTIAAERLTDAEVEKALIQATATTGPLGLEVDDFRISIAGAQEKSAFLLHEGTWCRPRGATPTTHIFKLPLGLVGGIQADMTSSAENEWLCTAILRRHGIPVPNCQIRQFGSQKVLIVERFDRQLHSSGSYWLRLVQEDFCQAFGVPSTMKYERDGGPGILGISGILRNSVSRDADLQIFLKAQVLFWMLAAGDGHAKNFSLRILSGGRYQLTPLYDVISYWPIVGNGANKISLQKVRMAMALHGRNKHYSWDEIRRRHFNDTAARIGIRTAEPLIEEILAKTPQVVADIEREMPNAIPAQMADAILGGLRSSAKALQEMPTRAAGADS